MQSVVSLDVHSSSSTYSRSNRDRRTEYSPSKKAYYSELNERAEYLVGKWQRKKCQRVGKKITDAVVPYVLGKCRKQFCNLDPDEVDSIALLSIAIAIQKFDNRRGVHFLNFATNITQLRLINAVNMQTKRYECEIPFTTCDDNAGMESAYSDEKLSVVSDNDFGLIVWEGIKLLTRKQRKVFYMIAICGVEIQTVADALSMSYRGVTACLSKARENLTKYLEGVSMRSGTWSRTRYVAQEPLTST